jgi:hypothetical protein
MIAMIAIEHTSEPMQQFDFQHRNKEFFIRVTDGQSLQLYVDHCLRKERPRSGREPQYVWTNVELEWEEHHYIEARYWAADRRLQVTVNGNVLMDGTLKAA